MLWRSPGSIPLLQSLFLTLLWQFFLFCFLECWSLVSAQCWYFFFQSSLSTYTLNHHLLTVYLFCIFSPYTCMFWMSDLRSRLSPQIFYLDVTCSKSESGSPHTRWFLFHILPIYKWLHHSFLGSCQKPGIWFLLFLYLLHPIKSCQLCLLNIIQLHPVISIPVSVC